MIREPGNFGICFHHGVLADAPAVTVSVTEPVPPETVPGTEQVVAVSVLATVQVNDTVPVNVPCGLMLMVDVPELPGFIVSVVGVGVIAKSSFHSVTMLYASADPQPVTWS